MLEYFEFSFRYRSSFYCFFIIIGLVHSDKCHARNKNACENTRFLPTLTN